ncbi:unnamed protein product [Rotaria sordida]|uniref:T4 RNA ligase 1-like N-terminal domain-containing protein n=1 Tax=Rotaria sordida TaxID=392033 RepID=A0A814MK86_9BILA|nr:unnamed protein product [Rotaria sordida]
MDTLYDDLMSLCSLDDTFYYKDIRLYSVKYRIFNYRLCSYATFQSRTAALNCRGTMFNMTNPKNVQLVSLPLEKFFNYEEGFGQKQYHERGRLGDKMEKMDGTLISTFLHGTASKELRLKSKQSLTSKQVVEAMQLLVDDFKTELEKLVRLNYTVDMEYTSPSNHVFVSYPQAQLTVLSIRSHTDGHTLFGTQLKKFLLENHFPTILDHLVPFESIPPDVTHKQLLQDIYQQPHGEGYVIEIIQSDRPSYLVKIKTQKYLMIHRDVILPNENTSKKILNVSYYAPAMKYLLDGHMWTKYIHHLDYSSEYGTVKLHNILIGEICLIHHPIFIIPLQHNVMITQNNHLIIHTNEIEINIIVNQQENYLNNRHIYFIVDSHKQNDYSNILVRPIESTNHFVLC